MEPFLFLLLGATGDLARKKLLPALYRLAQEHGEAFRVLGVGRSGWDDGAFRAHAVEALTDEGVPAKDAKAWT